MEKQKKINTLVICGLLIVIGGMTVGFAALSQRLDINGTATVKNATSSWNVLFSEVKNDKTGTASWATTPAISTVSEGNTGSSNTITFACDLVAPGDSCTATATIKNGGSLKAKYDGYTFKVNNENVTGTSKTLPSGAVVTVTPAPDWTANTTALAANDTGSFVIEMKLPTSVTSLPEENEATKVSLSINFSQVAE